MPTVPELPPGYRLTAPVAPARGLWRVADARGEHLLRPCASWSSWASSPSSAARA
jgi:hypothetical protein